MNRKEFTVLFAKRNALRISMAERIVNAIFEELAKSLEKGERIEFRGFGSFFTKEYAPYKARNPKSGASIDVGSRKKVRFRPSTLLHEQINEALL